MIRAKFYWKCPIGNWKRFGKHWRTWRIIFNDIQYANKNRIPQVRRITVAVQHFGLKISEILQAKLSKAAAPQTPMSPPLLLIPKIIFNTSNNNINPRLKFHSVLSVLSAWNSCGLICPFQTLAILNPRV